MQQKLWLNRGQGQIWTWFKLDWRWWNAPLAYLLPSSFILGSAGTEERDPVISLTGQETPVSLDRAGKS